MGLPRPPRPVLVAVIRSSLTLFVSLVLVSCSDDPSEPVGDGGQVPEAPGDAADDPSDAPALDPSSSGTADADPDSAEEASPEGDAAAEEAPPSAWRKGVSQDGHYEVAWRVVDHPGVPMNEHFELELELFRVEGDERVAWEGAEPDVRATMPEHRHGMLTRPAAEDLGDGRYKVPAMLFHMEGYWVLHVSVRTGEGVLDIDHANFDIHI